MRSDFVVYGPNHWYSANYYYNETFLNFGQSLNDSDDKVAFGFEIDKTATISGVGMYLIDIIGTPPTDYQLGIVTVSGQAGGGLSYPSDTLYGGGGWQDFDPIVVGSGWSWTNLDTQVSAVKGDYVALVVKPGATTPNGSNYVEINDESAWWSRNPGKWRYNASWTRYNFLSPAALRYTDDSFIGIPIVSPNWEEYSSPAEWGLEFQLPIGATCVGLVINQYIGDNDAPFKAVLADSSDAELASITIDNIDLVGGTGGDYAYISWDSPSSNPVLSADTSYRLFLKPTSASTINKQGITFNEEGDKVSQIGGTNWKWIERANPAASWTYYPTRYPWLSVLLTDLVGGNGGNGGGEGGAAFGFIG